MKEAVKDFAIIGAAGYIAPRHLKAIKDTGNNLIAALDPNDSVGILDKYFPDAKFFNKFEQFDDYIHKCKVDYISVCSPNHLHNAHVRAALLAGVNVICEKPLVLNSHELDAIKSLERGKRVFNILQLRLHPLLTALKERLTKEKHNVTLRYITPRGDWYRSSWKSNPRLSGGLVTNIGIHIFDLLIWLFGDVKKIEIDAVDEFGAVGKLELSNASVGWFLSTNGKCVHRSIKIDGDEIDFSQGFADLHTESYRRILAGDGFGIEDVRPSIVLVENIRRVNDQSRKD